MHNSQPKIFMNIKPTMGIYYATTNGNLQDQYFFSCMHIQWQHNQFKYMHTEAQSSNPGYSNNTTENWLEWKLGPPVSIQTPSFLGIRISTIKVRWSRDHLIFIMEIPKLVRWHLYIGTPSRRFQWLQFNLEALELVTLTAFFWLYWQPSLPLAAVIL